MRCVLTPKMTPSVCKHEYIKRGVVVKCTNTTDEGRQECNSCKVRLYRERERNRVMLLKHDNESLKNKLSLKSEEMDELRRDFIKLSKDHAALAMSYKKLLEDALVMQTEKSLTLDSIKSSVLTVRKDV